MKYEHKRWNACQENKRALITIIWGQIDDGTRNELDIFKGYKEEMAKKYVNIITILNMINAICNGNADGGLSYPPYKNAVALRNITNYVNPKVEDPHHFKTELKTKFQALLASSGKFSFGTIYMEEMMKKNMDGQMPKPYTLSDYFKMSEEDQAMWEKKGNDLAISMMWLNQSINKNMKCELRLAYSQGNKDCYLTDPETMARHAATQYRMSAPRSGPRGGQRGDESSPMKENDGNTDPSKMSGNELQETVGVHVGNDNEEKDKLSKADKAKKDKSDDKSDGSLGFHLLEPTGKQSEEPTSVNDLLGTYPIDHPIWGNEDESVSDDSCDSAEMMAGIHTTETHESESEEDNVFAGYLESSSDETTSNEDDLNVSGYLCMFRNGGTKHNFHPDNDNSYCYEEDDESTVTEDLCLEEKLRQQRYIEDELIHCGDEEMEIFARAEGIDENVISRFKVGSIKVPNQHEAAQHNEPDAYDTKSDDAMNATIDRGQQVIVEEVDKEVTVSGGEEDHLGNVEVEELFPRAIGSASSAHSNNEEYCHQTQAETKVSTPTNHQGNIKLYWQAAQPGHRKFYAVAHGRTPGIYTDWASCAREV